MMRAFIAATFSIPQEIRDLLRRLSRIDHSLRPVSPENIHVTLKFLGEIEAGQIASISRTIERVIPERQVVEVQFRGLGAFPSRARPSVIWVGMQPAEPLAMWATALEEGCARLGIAREGRVFQPHLTLLRVKSRPPQELFDFLDELADVEFGSTRIAALTLFQSELRPEGPRYTELFAARF